ncbi:hypothetical protein WJ0W_003345 [Paenibacillus melissococcoides]|uniref:Uncharacterized protein n=1 Tax=Paenibacillus melissococcoides TaxID=2912268 RepID=A0ABM9G349_9BACL|nr:MULTISPECIES: hypothetical protein [Paenibacillus]MEB9893221.1 hypothetical protein [Bacillus cereus]CAH8246108.1 hypothetical protein WJ0W_003345 [Paenibacillus melissococcoides]CAH8712995.1 hypothetical protein WDD9_003423 [Paenibacillus melissococcoides]CAH8713729.1 hypothetical protein HTL2_003726 [Paenibacillus melissococcoides]
MQWLLYGKRTPEDKGGENVHSAEIRAGVIRRLGEIFPGMPVLDAEGAADATAPYCAVRIRSGSRQRTGERRYAAAWQVEVDYVPGEAGERPHPDEVADALYDALELVDFGTMRCRGAEMGHEYPDHLLRFRVQYALTLLRDREPGSKMEAMKQEGRIQDEH